MFVLSMYVCSNVCIQLNIISYTEPISALFESPIYIRPCYIAVLRASKRFKSLCDMYNRKKKEQQSSKSGDGQSFKVTLHIAGVSASPEVQRLHEFQSKQKRFCACFIIYSEFSVT